MKRHRRQLMPAAATLAGLLFYASAAVCHAKAPTRSLPPSTPNPITNSLPRDPFWPTGYVPRIVKETLQEEQLTAEVQAQAEALVQWPTLSLAGITKAGDRNIGLIQGVGLVEAGDMVRLSRKGVMYKWRIISVSEDGLSYQKLSATSLPLRAGGTAETED